MLLNKFKSRFYNFLRSIRDAWDRFLSPFRSFSFVKDIRKFESTASKNLMFFVHFDKDELLEDYVINLVKDYSEGLACKVIFISNSGYNENKMKKLLPYLAGFIQRKNVGLDFFAWKTAMKLYEAEVDQAEKVFLANDSVYGFLNSASVFNGDLETDKPTIIGATDSFEIHYHLQSYFLGFNRAVLETDVFKEFWKSVRCLGLKHKIVEKYEVGFSQQMLKHQIELKPMVTYSKLRSVASEAKLESCKGYDYRGLPMNPTNYFARELIEEFSFPFLKVSYLRDNPYGELKNYDVLKAVEKSRPELSYMIKKHLHRVGRYSQY